MIAHLKGTLAEKTPQAVVVDVGGVGYRVFIPLSVFPQLPDVGKPLRLYTYTYVREDALHLYGFLDPRQREVFSRLLTVSGVGPRMALAVLSGLSVEALQEVVETGDATQLAAIPGIGAKTAGRILVELRGRWSPVQESTGAGSPLGEEACSALVNLGYPPARARAAVSRVARQLPPEASLEEWIRQALRHLAPPASG